MDNNDMFSKISQMLENPQSADVIKQIASSFSTPSESAAESESFEPEKLTAMMSGAGKNDKNISLLRAIEPYMSGARANKIESAVKAIRIINMLSYLQ